MPETYAEVEERISQAIVAINTRENVSRNKIAQEFQVPIQKLRSRLNGHPPAGTVQRVHGRRLAPDQEKALHDYFIQLDKTGMLARLHMIEQVTNSLFQISTDLTKSPPEVGPLQSKRWSQRQYDLFKVRKKPIAAVRKNTQDFKMMMEYFKTYKAVVDKFGIQSEDQWNFDKTEYRMEMGREDWVILVDVIWRIYSKCPDNQESCIAIKCINGVGRDILPILILTSIK